MYHSDNKYQCIPFYSFFLKKKNFKKKGKQVPSTVKNKKVLMIISAMVLGCLFCSKCCLKCFGSERRCHLAKVIQLFLGIGWTKKLAAQLLSLCSWKMFLMMTVSQWVGHRSMYQEVTSSIHGRARAQVSSSAPSGDHTGGC